MRYALLLLLLLPLSGTTATPLHVGVAANFRATLATINAEFEAASGYTVTLSSGSTGTLYTQILYGAPYHVFFAADKKAAAKLAELGHGGQDGSFCYATGKLVLRGGNGTLEQLANPALSLSIANPVTAPYGEAAFEVLQRPAYGAASSRKLVRGNNVVQAYQFWHSGSTDLALTPQSLSPGEGTPIPTTWHQPLEQHAIALKSGMDHPAIDPYLKWIRSDRVSKQIQTAGYDACP